MSVPSKPLPVLGESTLTEDPKTRDVLAELQTILSGNVDLTNIAAAVFNAMIRVEGQTQPLTMRIIPITASAGPTSPGSFTFTLSTFTTQCVFAGIVGWIAKSSDGSAIASPDGMAIRAFAYGAEAKAEFTNISAATKRFDGQAIALGF